MQTGGISQEFLRLKELCKSHPGKISLKVLIDGLTSSSHALTTLILSFPFLLPMPLPGLSIPFGLIITVAGASLAIGKNPWLPKKPMHYQFSTALLLRIFDMGLKWSSFIEKFVKRRGETVLPSGLLKPINGCMILFCGFLLALPLPPGTNFPPALVIFLLSLGLLAEDIVVNILGYILFGILFFIVIKALEIGINFVLKMEGYL